MTREVKVFLIVLLINSIVALVYLLLKYFRREEKRNSFVIKTLIMLLCPVAGPLFFAGSYLIFRLFMSEPVDLADVIFSKERVRTFLKADEDRERNMVSLEEAIEIMDKDNLRGIMMNVVRGDIQKSLNAISLALNSEDSETAHYAASILQETLNDFRINVQNQYELMLNEGPDETYYAETLLDYMNKVLKQRVFTDIEQKDLVETMDRVGEYFFQKKSGRFTARIFENLSLRLLEVENYEDCEKWCERAVYMFPDALSTYTCQLKLYFANGQKERFFEVMDNLRKSSVVIDNETLEMLRVFM